MTIRETIQDALEEDRLIVGTRESIKHADELSQVILARNAPQSLREDVADAADSNGVDVTEFEGDNRELGAVCRKPFAASTVGIKE